MRFHKGPGRLDMFSSSLRSFARCLRKKPSDYENDSGVLGDVAQSRFNQDELPAVHYLKCLDKRHVIEN